MKSFKDTLLKTNLITLSVTFVVLFGIEAYNIRTLSDRIQSAEKVVSQETLAVIERTTQGNFLILGLGVFGMLALSSLATLLIGLRFNQTLAKLSRTTRLIAHGDYNAAIDEVDDVDIAALAKAIDDLRHIIKATKVELETLTPRVNAADRLLSVNAMQPPALRATSNDETAVAIAETVGNRELTDTEKLPFVLVVDDDPDIRQIMAAVLSTHNIRIQLANGGQEALTMIGDKKPDLVLLDVMMPGLSGYEVCRRIRQQYNPNELPVVMLTARSELADLKESFDVGANDFITKPFIQQEIVVRIRAQIAISSLYLALRKAERDLANLRIRQNENRFKKLFDATFEGIIIHQGGRIIDVNDAATNLFEMVADKMMGCDLNELLSDTTRAAFEDVSEESNMGMREAIAKKSSGEEFPVEFASRPYEVKGRGAIISCVRDITSRKAADHKIVNQQHMLVEAAKMRSLGQMAGGIAHEINNPLTIIDFSIQQIKDYFEKADGAPPLIQARLRALDSALPRIVEVVKDLRYFCRESTDDHFEKVPVYQLVEGAFGISQAQLESMDITIKVSNIDRGMIVECRKNEVIQALHNVILNARDAVLVANHKWIQVDCEVQEGQLLMAVTDSGLLQKNISDRIMEPFFTTKEVGRGRGMGLSVTLGLIKGHGGRFYYDSSSPNTRFVIEVPLTQASAQAA